MGDLEIRPAQQRDIPQILDVLKAALGETPMLRRTPELWDWKHARNPFGRSLVLVAMAGSRIAGVRAMMRWELTTPEGGVLRCLRPVDTATHPDFARRGVFRELTMSAIELARSEKVDLVFNTPNARSGPGYLAMGWSEVGDIGVMARVRIGPVVGTHEGEPPNVFDLARGAGPFRTVAEASRRPAGLRTVRSEGYQAWRFGAHPTVPYGSVPDERGAAVLRAGVRRGRPELVLSDLLGGAGRSAIRAAARMNRARYIAGYFSPGSPERAASFAGGMIPVPRTTGLRLVALPLTDLDIDVFNLSSWDVSTSDFELL